MDYNINSNSDDDFDGSCNGYGNDSISDHVNKNQVRNPNGMSKAELRRSNKPIMEKRRRARINHCLNELKSLILEAMKKDPARHTKLEKADILEMTVKHLQSMQRRQLSMAIQTDPTVIHKFKTGFVECADEVKRYISQLDGFDTVTRQRLLNYLNNCANNLEQIGSYNNYSKRFQSPTTPEYSAIISNRSSYTASNDTNNNNRHVQLTRMNFIPSLLPSGEVALILPSTNIKTSNNNDRPLFCIPNTPNTPHMNIDFSNDFSRVSAFTKPNGRTSYSKRTCYDINVSVQSATTSSPPLSPISSVSSQEDDSIMHTSSDFASRSITPTLDGSGSSCTGGFTTPSSSESIKVLSRTVNVAQQNRFTSSDEENFLSKRLYPYEYSVESSSEELSIKKPKTENSELSNSNENLKKEDEEASENMWRPW